jgi:hypothetical protein
MNKTIASRAAGATALFAVLLASAACGTETVDQTDPGAPVGKHGRVIGHGGTSADTAERHAQEQKARAERADALRAAQGHQQMLDKAGLPGRP